jgi:CheY-like chemotaxis protein
MDRVAEADAQGSPYDVLFIDWKMPGLNGLETAAQIRMLSLRTAHPRMVLVAPADFGCGEADERAPFDCVLEKPVMPARVVDAVIELFAPARERKAEPVTGEANWQSLGGRRALLVEDNAINQEVVHDLLEMVGMRVAVANNGAEALQILNNAEFDVILMDVQMPIMNGFETAAAIRKDKRFAAVPIIALTANALDGDRDRCLAGGMDDYIAKPIDPKRMFSTLARHCAPLAEAMATEPAAAEEGEDAWRLVASLAGIPGLDTEQGLACVMGRADIYAKLARRIAWERSDLPARLDAALAAGDMEEIGNLLHGAKSLLGTLGATRLRTACIELEDRLSRGVPAESDIAEFNADFSRLIASLRAVMPGEEA